jgi:hypothetical protein
LGLPPWFALFFFRLRRLRARFDMFTPRRQSWSTSQVCHGVPFWLDGAGPVEREEVAGG